MNKEISQPSHQNPEKKNSLKNDLVDRSGPFLIGTGLTVFGVGVAHKETSLIIAGSIITSTGFEVLARSLRK